MSDTAGPPSLPPTSVPPSPVPRNDLKWPKVLGILNIVFGVLGVGTGIFTFFTSQFTKAMMKFAASLEPGMLDDDYWQRFDAVQAKWAWSTNLYGGLYVVANIFLILAGIACLRLKKKCRPLFLAFSVITFLCMGFYAWMLIATPMVREQTEVTAAPDQMGEAAIALQTTISQVFGVVSLVLYLILPVFLIIWFSRKKISADLSVRFD